MTLLRVLFLVAAIVAGLLLPATGASADPLTGSPPPADCPFTPDDPGGIGG